MPTINPTNLKTLRKKKRWSLADLAEKSGVDRGTIHRIESGKHTESRRVTVERLAHALQAEVDLLTGAPFELGAATEASRKSQMNVRMTDEARNALALVAIRYRVKQSSIIHLAPLLFLWAAESSLRERSDKLARLEEQLNAVGPQSDFAHLASELTWSARSEEIIASERRSVEQHDLFGLTIPDEQCAYDYEQSEQNPFARFLAKLTTSLEGLAEFEHWSPFWDQPGYTLGRTEAAALVGGDEEAVEHIVCGNVALHEMPKDVSTSGPAKIAEWVRSEGDAYVASMDINIDIEGMLG
jgi:transcriptional regulator with XRE-family HTH domain